MDVRDVRKQRKQRSKKVKNENVCPLPKNKRSCLAKEYKKIEGRNKYRISGCGGRRGNRIVDRFRSDADIRV